jgi:uncharacterized spore protein YtfJ
MPFGFGAGGRKLTGKCGPDAFLVRPGPVNWPDNEARTPFGSGAGAGKLAGKLAPDAFWVRSRDREIGRKMRSGRISGQKPEPEN